jgi:hypothetical protein
MSHIEYRILDLLSSNPWYLISDIDFRHPESIAARGHAAVDNDLGAGDEACLVGSQK